MDFADWAEFRAQKRLDNWPKETVDTICGMLAEIDAIKNDWHAATARTSPRIISHLTRLNVVTSAGASYRIAGHHVTDKHVADLYTGFGQSKVSAPIKQEVAGYLECLQTIFDSHQDISISADSILHLHNALRIKKEEVIPPHFKTTAPYLVKKEMDALIEWYIFTSSAKSHHPLIVMANFIFEYLAIHPFQDGNGRTSRLLTNLMLLQGGYTFAAIASHDHVIETKEESYFHALRQTHKTWKTKAEDITPWLLFLLGAVKTQGMQALKTIKQDNAAILLPPHHLALLAFARRRSARPFNSKEARAALRLSPCTVETLLSKLTDMHRLEKRGHGKTAQYRAL